MQEDFIEPIVKQFQDDIIIGYRQLFIKKGITDVNDFKEGMKKFLVNCADARQEKNIPAKFLNKAYKQIDHPDIVSGETLCINLLKQLMGGYAFNKKSTEDKVSHCHDILNNLFYKVTSSIISLYAGSILEGRNQDKIKAAIEEEIRDYFNDIKAQYSQKYPSLSVLNNDSMNAMPLSYKSYNDSMNTIPPSYKSYNDSMNTVPSLYKPPNMSSPFNSNDDGKGKDYEAKYKALKEQMKLMSSKESIVEVKSDKLDSYF